MSSSTEMSIPTHEALTADMMLGLKPSCPNSRSYRVNISPNNMSVFSPQSTISIDIPTGRSGTWLDQSQSYLKYAVQCINSNSDNVYVENSAYSFIQRLDVFHQSNLFLLIYSFIYLRMMMRCIMVDQHNGLVLGKL